MAKPEPTPRRRGANVSLDVALYDRLRALSDQTKIPICRIIEQGAKRRADELEAQIAAAADKTKRRAKGGAR